MARLVLAKMHPIAAAPLDWLLAGGAGCAVSKVWHTVYTPSTSIWPASQYP
jgi:hypothetical protein